jgi:Lar family restriction alleviation protein
MANLKPCPFCGSNNVEYNREHISGEHRVECGNCNLAVLFDVDLTDEQAIAAWNRRADTPGRPRI